MTTILTLAALAPAFQSTSINAYLQTGLRDAAFTAKVLQKNQKELAKINDDFEQGYKFETVSFRVKEPFMVRADSNVEDTTVTYVINGGRRLIKVPRIKVNVRQDISKKPGNRQTVFDFGVLTPSLFEDLFDAKFVRMDRATGDAVFDLTYKPVFKDTTSYRVWIDPAKKYIAKREWYHRTDHRLEATFYYEAPLTEGGATMPTKLTVRNADDAVAGVTSYGGLKLNRGIADDVFAF